MIHTLDTKYDIPYEMELNNAIATGLSDSENDPCISLAMIEQTLQQTDVLHSDIEPNSVPSSESSHVYSMLPLDESPAPPTPLECISPSFDEEPPQKTSTGKIISSNKKLDEIFDLVCNGGGESRQYRLPVVIKSEPMLAIDNSFADDAKHFCSLCKNKEFKAERYYKQHYNSVHVYTGPKQYKCMLCQRSFHTERALQKHIDHEMYKPFSCEQCNRTFNRKPDLMRHSFVHLKTKPFTCKACQKSFIRRDQLTSHYRNCPADKNN